MDFAGPSGSKSGSKVLEEVCVVGAYQKVQRRNVHKGKKLGPRKCCMEFLRSCSLYRN